MQLLQTVRIYVTVYVKTHHMGYTRILRNARFQYFWSVFVKLQFHIQKPFFYLLPSLTKAKRKLLRQNKPSLTSVSIYLVSAAASARSPLLWVLIRIRASQLSRYSYIHLSTEQRSTFCTSYPVRKKLRWQRSSFVRSSRSLWVTLPLLKLRHDTCKYTYSIRIYSTRTQQRLQTAISRFLCWQRGCTKSALSRQRNARSVSNSVEGQFYGSTYQIYNKLDFHKISHMAGFHVAGHICAVAVKTALIPVLSHQQEPVWHQDVGASFQDSNYQLWKRS